MTRYSQAEKMEIIHQVETSELPVKQTLAELEVPRRTFYDWYRRYLEAGYDSLADQQPHPRQRARAGRRGGAGEHRAVTAPVGRASD